MKRVSRKELKERIKQLRYLVNIREVEAEKYQRQYADLEKRFRKMGSQIETIQTEGTPIHCIRVDPKPFGKYAISSGFLYKDAICEEITKDIVKYLIDNNFVQVIEGSGDSIFPEYTIGVKLYVVPWEMLGRSINLKFRDTEV